LGTAAENGSAAADEKQWVAINRRADEKGRAGVACPLQKVARIGYWPKISVP
jgi:hypothetical protein